jgi:hypothetical protein
VTETQGWILIVLIGIIALVFLLRLLGSGGWSRRT